MGIDDLINKAKEAISGSGEKTEGLVEQAKGLVSDERIDAAAEAIKKVTPDSIDGHVDTIANQAKKLNE